MVFSVLAGMHLKSQKVGFTINQAPTGHYTLLHFINPIDITIGGHTVRTSSNACVLYTPDAPRNYVAASIRMYHNYLIFDVDDASGLADMGIPFNRVFYTDLQDEITQKIEYIEFFLGASEKNPNVNKTRMAENAAGKLMRALADEQKHGRVVFGRSAQALFDELRTLVYKAPKEWNVPKMAAYTHLSRSHFSVKYKDIFGVSPNEDISCAALLYADRLLETTEMSVAKIAEECGFSNTEYFINFYKKRNGITPGKARKTAYSGIPL